MRRPPGSRTVQHLIGLGRTGGLRAGAAGRPATTLVTAGLEPLALASWRSPGRLGVSRHWRGFAQQAGAGQEQEPGTSSKASRDDAEKADSKAEAVEEDEAGKAGAKEAEAEAEAKEAEAADASKAEEAAESAEAEAEELSPVERLRRDLEDFQEKSKGRRKELLLALADFENRKKKFNKERESRRRVATANFARRMVEVYEEFEGLPSLKAVPQTNAEEGNPCVALQEGVALTRDLFAAALERSNVEKLPVELGTPIVNARHEVVGSVAGDGGLPEGSIAEVAEEGWIMDMRSSSPQVIQKAKVKTVGGASQTTAE